MFQVKIRSAIKVVLWLILVASGYTSTSFASEESSFENQIEIEHAEIVLPAEGSNVAEAYLVIWNGTGDSTIIKSIEGQSGTAQLVNAKKTSDGQIAILPSSMPRHIPPHSELVMKKSGHYLSVQIEDKADSISNFTFIVEFSDGRKLIADARVLSAGSKPTDHHHGSDDN